MSSSSPESNLPLPSPSSSSSSGSSSLLSQTIASFKSKITGRYEDDEDDNPMNKARIAKVNPLRKIAELIVIHQNPNNPNDPYNLNLYPCNSTYEQVIKNNTERKKKTVKVPRIDESDSNVPRVQSNSSESDPQDDPCHRCNCLPQYHRSDTPSISCIVMKGQISKTDPNMMTSGGYCLSCLEAGTLCWMKSHPKINLSSNVFIKTGTINFQFTEEGDYLKFNYFIDGKLSESIFRSLQDKKCYIRHCYTELCPHILSEDENHSSIVTGTSGIGKSTFLIYILAEYMKNEKLKSKPFVVSFKNSSFFLFSYKSDYNYSYSETNDFSNVIHFYPDLKFNLIIYDYSDHTIRDQLYASSTIILSSPNRHRYKHFLKENTSTRTFYMPVWTYRELLKLDPEENHWKSGYDIFGGVPRYILNTLSKGSILPINDFNKQYKYEIDERIKEKGPDIIKKWLRYDSALYEEMSHLIIHKVPSTDLEGNIPDYKDYGFSFPSRYIYNALLGLNKKYFINQMRTLINSGTITTHRISNPEDFFEDSFLDFCPPTPGSTITVTQLYTGRGPGRLLTDQSAATINFNFPPSTRSFVPGNLEHFESNVFYIPSIRNFQSVDAFFFQENNLYNFQLTTGKRHPVDYNGLMDIKNFFQSGQGIEINLYLIFVVPVGNPIKYKQTITHSPQDININQYLWTYEIPDYRDANAP